MIVPIKFFYENSNSTREENDKIWQENRDRLVFLHTNLSLSQQRNSIKNQLSENKDILAARFPSFHILRNKLIKDILQGKGVSYDDNIWYPKEIWIYTPIDQ